MTITVCPVRKACPPDEPELMDICRAGFDEHRMFQMDDARVTTMLNRAFTGQGAIIGALGPTGKIEGAIYLLISQFWYSSEWCLEELFCYVRPQFRKSTNAKDLIEFGKRCASELGLPLVMGIVSNERTQAKIGLYRRQLSDPVGAYFAYNMPQRKMVAV